MRNFALLVLVAASGACGLASAQGLTVDRGAGEPMRTPLAFGVELNEGSTLSRTKIVLNDSSAPFRIEPTAGVGVMYVSKGGGSMAMYARPTVSAKEPLVAYEYRVLIIDVFGRTLRTLSATQVVDVKTEHWTTAEWRIWRDSDAANFHTSIIYPYAARTADGRVYQIDKKALTVALSKVSQSISEADLEPTPPPQR